MIVPVELFVMSKCPDAVAVESLFANVLSRVGSIVDFTVSYIGSNGLCKHGLDECIGNKQQLCAASILPKSTWLDFVSCSNTHYSAIPHVDACLDFNPKDLVAWKSCVNGQQGSDLLNASNSRSLSLGVTVSATIYINNAKVCVHDGDWVDCPHHSEDDFVEAICSAYQGIHPACPSLSSQSL